MYTSIHLYIYIYYPPAIPPPLSPLPALKIMCSLCVVHRESEVCRGGRIPPAEVDLFEFLQFVKLTLTDCVIVAVDVCCDEGPVCAICGRGTFIILLVRARS